MLVPHALCAHQPDQVEEVSENLGEYLQGTTIESSPYDVHLSCCFLQLTVAELTVVRRV